MSYQWLLIRPSKNLFRWKQPLTAPKNGSNEVIHNCLGFPSSDWLVSLLSVKGLGSMADVASQCGYSRMFESGYSGFCRADRLEFSSKSKLTSGSRCMRLAMGLNCAG